MNNELEKVWLMWQELSGTTGKKDKVSIMVNSFNKDQSLYDILYFLVNPYTVTNIGRKSLSKKIPDMRTQEISDLEWLTSFLRGSSGTDSDIKAIQNLIESSDPKYKNMLTSIVTKTSTTLGIGIKLFNEACEIAKVPKCPDFGVMLAKDLRKEKSLDFITEMVGTLKLDGIRCLAIKQSGEIKFYSRKGLPILGLKDIASSMLELKDDYVYDGELILENPDGLNSGDLFRATQSVVRSKNDDKKGLEYHLFDLMPAKEFYQGESSKDYNGRREELDELPELELIKKVPVLYRGTNIDEVYALANELISQGKEGLIINNASAKYETKRTKNLLKVKGLYTNDGVVVGFYKGKEGTKFEHTLGGMIVTYKDSTTRIGGGFSDAEREQIWDNQEDYLGKVVEYYFSEKSQNEDGVENVRFGRLLGFRFDKSPEDVNYED